MVTIDTYRNLPTPYPTVPLPTLYDVPFSHNTKRYRQTDDRWTEHRTISATLLPAKNRRKERINNTQENCSEMAVTQADGGRLQTEAAVVEVKLPIGECTF